MIRITFLLRRKPDLAGSGSVGVVRSELVSDAAKLCGEP